MDDRDDDHHEPYRFLQEAYPRQARQVPGDGPDVPERGAYSLSAGNLTRSDQTLIGHGAHREPAPHGEPAV